MGDNRLLALGVHGRYARGMPADTAEIERIAKIINTVVTKLDADVALYNGAINERDVEKLTAEMLKRQRRKNLFLILTTYGGDPDAAYALARCVHRCYDRFIAYVPGYCKSAGTLVVVGAHELVLAPQAQLGPLDIQLSHSDEVGLRRSGLAPTEALRVLETRARETYRKSFEDLRKRIGMPTKLAAEIASRFVTGLYRTSFAHVDPIRLGEMDRANRIAHQYGERLVRSAGPGANVKDGTLLKLVADFPSHEFVIDITEAEELFKQVRVPTTEEAGLDTVIAMRRPLNGNEALTFFIDTDLTPTEEADAAQQSDGTAEGGGEPQVGPDGEAVGAPSATGVRHRATRAAGSGAG